jgi:hypothetical protein
MDELSEVLAYAACGAFLFVAGLWVGSLAGANARSQVKKLRDDNQRQQNAAFALYDEIERLESVVRRQSRVIRGEGEAWKLG